MQTHNDRDAESLKKALAKEFMGRLERRADAMTRNKESEITAGKEGEEELASWRSGKMQVRHLPDDEQGILRISVGGKDHPVPLNYCVIRGSVGECIALLEDAISALRDSP